ncbi:MAG: hypothetical protein ACLFNY_03270 [Candidatus Aenigmatarchaeota archaeon]
MAPLPVEFVGKTVGSVKEKSPPDTDVVGAPPFTHMPIVLFSSLQDRDCDILTLTASIRCLQLYDYMYVK